MNFQRYAVYYAPQYTPLAQFGADWLGWDAIHGMSADHPDIAGLPRPVAEITAAPRKYGFHATIKPPMRLAEGSSYDRVAQDLEALARKTRPVALAGLELTQLGRFLALTISGDASGLNVVAADVVKTLDRHRAPMTEAELLRRDTPGLTEAQRENLRTWGYPYVLDDYRFHMTLTGKLPKAEASSLAETLKPVLLPLLPQPFIINALCIYGEAEDGQFHHIESFPLGRI